MDKEVEVNGKKYIVKELKYKDIAKFSNTTKEDTPKNIMLLSIEMTEDEYNELSMKDGLEIQKVINELNGLIDFQKPLNA